MRIFLVKLFVAALSIFFFAGLGFANGNSVEHLDSLISEALNNNPQIDQALNAWKAAKYKVTEARSLPDPKAYYGYFGESIQTKLGPMEQKAGGSLSIPFPSKLVVKGRAQKKTSEILKEEYEAVKREIVKEIKWTYYDIYWVDQAIQITMGEKTILGSLERVATKRYEANLAPQQDAIKAQVEISRLIDRLFVLRQNRSSLVAQMNTLLNRPRYAPLGGLASIGASFFPYDLEQLREMAKESRQELQEARLFIERAEHEKTLAKLDFVPDFTFGFDYTVIGAGSTAMVNDGRNAWLGTVSINVPIWFNKLNAKLKEKKSLLSASKKRFENVTNSTDYEVENVYYKIISYKNIVDLHRTALIPQTEQAFNSAKLSYEAGKVDFLNWLDAERTLLQTRLSYYKAIVDYKKAIAHLERVVGNDL